MNWAASTGSTGSGGVADWGQDNSKVLVTKWSAAPIKSEHPILRGITPWIYDQEEFFFKETMPADPRRTPLLAVTRPTGGDAETVSWAVERAGRRPRIRVHRLGFPQEHGDRATSPNAAEWNLVGGEDRSAGGRRLVHPRKSC